MTPQINLEAKHKDNPRAVTFIRFGKMIVRMNQPTSTIGARATLEMLTNVSTPLTFNIKRPIMQSSPFVSYGEKITTSPITRRQIQGTRA